MEDEFVTYRKFNDLALAEDLIATLKDGHIDYETEESRVAFDPAYIYNQNTTEYAVKLNPTDFEKVDRLLIEAEKQTIGEVDADYYLFGFTDAELMDVLINYDEWSKFDFVLARKLLADRGHEVDDRKLETLKREKIAKLEQPEKPQTLWIVIGYVCALVGGVFGIFIGWYLSRGQKTLPNGEQVYIFSLNDRKQGSRIFVLGIITLLCIIIFRIYRANN